MSELLQERAYRLILDRIVRGSLPPGGRLSEPDLADEIGISRTPVRDAVTQLQCEGLIERKPRYGTFVRELNENDIKELYELREGLESFATGLAAERISEGDLERLAGLLEKTMSIADSLKRSGAEELSGGPMRTFLAADMGFHAIIIQSAGNFRITKIIAQSHILSGIFSRQRISHRLEVVRKVVKSHSLILKALENHDPEAASEAVASHIRQSKHNSLMYHGYKSNHAKAQEVALGLMPREVARELNRIERDMTNRNKQK